MSAWTEWFEAKGDETHRLSYPLTAESVVFDLGGYKGDFAAAIHERYGCTVFVFEPVWEYCRAIRDRFKGKLSVHVFGYGLGPKDGAFEMSVAGDASSMFKANGEGERVFIRQIDHFLKHEAAEWPEIDLIKINIEGAEYELLEHMADTGLLPRFRDIQVQFHAFISNAEERRAAIQKRLAETHRKTYDYPFVWENWSRI